MRDMCARTQFNRRKILLSLIGSAPLAALSAGGAGAVSGSATVMREQRQQGGVDRRTLVAAALATTQCLPPERLAPTPPAQ